MAPKMYAIVLDAPEPEVEARLRQHYGNVFKHTDTFLIVVGNVDDVSESVAVAAGIKGQHRRTSGVVFRLNGSYSGFTKRTLWEWLNDVAES